MQPKLNKNIKWVREMSMSTNLFDDSDVRSQIVLSGYDTYIGSVKHLFVAVRDENVLTIYPATSTAEVIEKVAESKLHCGLLGVLVDDVRIIDGKLSCAKKHIIPLLLLRKGGALLGDEQLRHSIVDEVFAKLNQPKLKQFVLDQVKSNRSIGDDSWVDNWLINEWQGKGNDWRVYVNEPYGTSSFCVRVDLGTGVCKGTTYNIKPAWVRVFESWVANLNELVVEWKRKSI